MVAATREVPGTRDAQTSPASSSGGSGSPSTRPIVRRSDRLFIVGATGTGKTTLATIMLAPLTHIVVIDPKWHFSFHNPPFVRKPKHGDPLVTSDLRKAERWDSPAPIVYRPEEGECSAGCPAFWRWIWDRENTIVFVDEVTLISRPYDLPSGYKRCVQQGRSRTIGVWSCTQRPAKVPTILLSEAEHFIAFETRAPQDLKRVTEYTTPEIGRDPATGYDFWYYGHRDKRPIKTDAYAWAGKVRK
jgi:hypothetical protein